MHGETVQFNRHLILRLSISNFKPICHLKLNYFHPIIFTLCVNNI